MRSRPQSGKPTLLSKQRILRQRDGYQSFTQNDFKIQVKQNYSPNQQLSPDVAFKNKQQFSAKILRNARPSTAVSNSESRKLQSNSQVGSRSRHHNNSMQIQQMSFIGSPLKVIPDLKQRKNLSVSRSRPMTAVQRQHDGNGQNFIQKNGMKASNGNWFNNQSDAFGSQSMKYSGDRDEPYRNIENINCRELIQKANRDIKSLTYQIQRIVTAEDSCHTLVNSKRTVDLEIVEQSLMYFKVHCKGQLSPVKILINLKENELMKGKKQDIKMYMSITSKEPNETDNQKFINQVGKPSFFSAPNKEKFTHDWIYFSLFSLTGCSMNICFTFAEETQRSRKKLHEDDIDQVQKNGQSRQDLREDAEEIDAFQLIKDKWNQITGDFMTKNVRDISNWEHAQNERHKKNQEQFDRLILAKQRQKDIEQQNIKKKYFLLHKWEFIKEKRKQYEGVVKDLKKQRNFKKRWAKLMMTQIVIKDIFAIYAQRRHEVIVENKKNYTVRRVAWLFRKYAGRIAPGRVARTQKRIMDAFSFGTCMINDVAEDKSKNIVKRFLKETGEIFSLKQQFRKFHNKMVYIQEKFRDLLNSYKNRCQVMSEIWEREKQFIIKDLILKKNKKKAGLMKKLNLLADDIKEAMIQAYLERCKIKYQLTFAEWRLHTHYTSDIPEFQKQREQMIMRIIKKKDRLFAYESLLFHGIDFDKETAPTAHINQQHQKQSQQQSTAQVKKSVIDSKNSSKPSMSASNQRSKSQPPGNQNTTKSKALSNSQSKNVIEKVVYYINEPPVFKFIPKRELFKKIIIKATEVKSVKELKL
eukprot:403365039